MAIERPDPATYARYFQQYVDQVPEGDLLFTLTSQVEATCALVAGFGEEGALHRYAEGKWSVKEVVGHVIDMERLFGYRALSYARGDTTPLPNVEEDEWAAASNANTLSLADLLDELLSVRRATVAFFANLDAAALSRNGIAGENKLTVACMAWVLAGHEIHHGGVVRERYK